MEIIALGIFLLLLLYTAIVIIEEKRAWRENLRLRRLGPFEFPVPSWWKESPGEKDAILFTTSGWRGTFRLLPPTEQNLRESLLGQINNQKIIFDEDATILHPSVLKKSTRTVRIEGTATEGEDTRIYFDAFLSEYPKTGQRLYGESKSSILGGPLENPWFEESLNNCCAAYSLVGKREEKNSESF